MEDDAVPPDSCYDNVEESVEVRFTGEVFSKDCDSEVSSVCSDLFQEVDSFELVSFFSEVGVFFLCYLSCKVSRYFAHSLEDEFLSGLGFVAMF